MVIYDLVCANNHGFEGWFKNNEDYEAQQEAKLIRCPACDSQIVKRKPSTIKISGKKSNTGNQTVEKLPSENQRDDSVSAMHFTSTAEQVRTIRHYIESNFEDVGNDLPNEVRKMHYGEVDQRGIRGQATAKEVADLAEEGIDLYAIPVGTKNKKDLN